MQSALLNKVDLIDGIFIKKSKKQTFSFWTVKDAYCSLTNLKNNHFYIESVKIYGSALITKAKFIADAKTIEIKPKHYSKIAKEVKKIHLLKSNRSVPEWKYLEFYKKILKKIKKPIYPYKKFLTTAKDATKFEKENYVVCHNDLHKGNILEHKGKIKLIDYDFCCMNYYLFDVCSFMEENKNIDQKKWLKNWKLTKKELADVPLMIQYQHLIWTMWANYCYENENDPVKKIVFLKIATKKWKLLRK